MRADTPPYPSPGDARARDFPLYDVAHERDSCGIGFVASVRGERSHRLVRLALRGLASLSHRGAVAADGESADGAGVTIQIPTELLVADVPGGVPDGGLAVAMVFLPTRAARAERARGILEEASAGVGFRVLGWRAVPVEESALGRLAAVTRPRIEQLMLATPPALEGDRVEQALYGARRVAERVLAEAAPETYVVSMSARLLVYKGLMAASRLGDFYPDLTDQRTKSALAVFHQRFATNTHPEWRLAQPFRRIAHNGEVNTLLGNRNWMRAREPMLARSRWGRSLPALTPVLTEGVSDTASLDETLDLLTSAGRDVLESMAILVPEAWEDMPGLSPAVRDFYRYHACLMEPWDGPAAVVFTDGTTVGATLDRNGLRPARFQLTSDGLAVVASEVGILDLPPGEVVESGRLGPGTMLAVDTGEARLLRNGEIKDELARRRPYGEWLDANLRRLRVSDAVTGRAAPGVKNASLDLERLQTLHGYTDEEVRLVLRPMAREGREPIGSMGDDAPLPVLDPTALPLYAYFRQRFAQVTNPPIDPLRERIVMSLDTYLGRRGSLLEPGPEAARLVHLRSPVLGEGALRSLRARGSSSLVTHDLDATFAAGVAGDGGGRVGTEVDGGAGKAAVERDAGGAGALEARLRDLLAEAEEAVRAGAEALVLSDRGVGKGRAPVPMLLAVSAVHQHLVRAGLRTATSLIAEAGDARDVHHVAALIGFGACAVHPYLALDTVSRPEDAAERPGRRRERYLAALEQGLLKIMSKMGISCVSSYRGAQIFEAIGLASEVVERWFPGTRSPVEGIGLAEIGEDVLLRHRAAFAGAAPGRGGWYRYRRGAGYHAHEPPVWRALHGVARGGGAEAYRRYADLVHARPPTALRDLLAFHSDRDPVPLDEVEPVEAIARRFQTGAMSLGALSPEAHEDVARAMRLLDGLSNSGEGGEDAQRYAPGGARSEAATRIKQVASGRFGVTTAYVAFAEELEIKMAQGSKAGEGGQLPGLKVSPYIASLRHVEPGTTLISPPPHHDIYCIEDLAQLIYDLRSVNPEARIGVKLVATAGVGTIAAGVAKARADVIHVSGADGGTGASPLSSIKYAGDPWELGVAEAHQTLVRNHLRSRVTLTTDGGLHTGRDVVKAAMLGAERYGFGTAALIALGCKMARQCHADTCPVGIATQAEELRSRYFGTPEMLVEFFVHVAGEVREILASLGYRALGEVVGRSDLLRQTPTSTDVRWRDVDLWRLLARFEVEADPQPAEPLERDRATEAPGHGPRGRIRASRGSEGRRLDDLILADAATVIRDGGRASFEYRIRNTDRSVGARLSGAIARVHGDAGLPPDSISVALEGSAGQSFGAWLAAGVTLTLEGEANDYVGKGMSGGAIVVRRHPRSALEGDAATLVGNTVLYGATGGSLLVAGRAGERFAVRNSGAVAVVEGVGEHACEYMTGGTVVVLGPTGRNFAAGMSGGRAYVFDEGGRFPQRVNPDLVDVRPLVGGEAADALLDLLRAHLRHTGSTRARRVMEGWPRSLPSFWLVVPRGAAAEDRNSRVPSETGDLATSPEGGVAHEAPPPPGGAFAPARPRP